MSQQDAQNQNLKRRSFDQWPVANPGLRLAAQIIDQSLVLFGITLFLLTFFPLKTWRTEWWLTLIFAWPLFSLCTQCLFIYYTGTTPGKKAFGLKVQNAKPETPLSPWQVMSRQSLWWLGALTLGAGWSTIFTRNDRRAWHDVVSESLVVTTGKISEPSTGTSVGEKALGHGWAVFVSLVFFSVLSTVMIFQFQRLTSSHNVKMASSSTLLPTIEEASWLLLTGQLEQATLKYESTDDEKISEHLMLFSEGMKLPVSERFAFYRNKMQSGEDQICMGNKADSFHCRSARVASALMSGVETKTSGEIMPAVGVLYKTEHADNLEAKSQILLDLLSHTSPTTPAYLAIKSLLVKSLATGGEFEKALDFVSFEKLPQTNNIVTEITAVKYYEYSCEVAAFAKCDVGNAIYCYDNGFWKSWSTGCTVKDKSLLSDNATRLGYAWKKQGDGELADSEWDEIKAAIKFPSDKEKQIVAAVDFSILVKKESPVELLEKSKNLGKDNVLWGWAQRQAVKEYGNQWLALVSPKEQRQATEYALKEKKPARDVASTAKKSKSKSSLKKQKSKKKKKI